MRYAGSCIEVPEKTAFLGLSVMRGSPPSSLLSRRKLLGGMRQAALAVPNSCWGQVPGRRKRVVKSPHTGRSPGKEEHAREPTSS